MTRPVFDARDAAIRATRLAAWNKRAGPRVGDFIHMLDGTLRRFTHDWDDGLQTTMPSIGGESFYLGLGYMSYSGALDPRIPLERIAAREGETRDGSAWFFHHERACGHNGVYFTVPCRVFEERA